MSSPRPDDGRARLRILAYHAIADLRDDPVIAEYAVPPGLFAAQLDELEGRGWSFVGLDEVLAALGGEGALPAKALLLTFDDAYADLLDVAAPILTERGIPAVVFAIGDRIGGSNEWDSRKGAASLDLLDGAGLGALAGLGIEVGSHGSSHRPLPEVPQEQLADEIQGSAERFERVGLPRPRVFSYPYGRWDGELASAVRAAGYELAFTTEWGVAGSDSERWSLPRIEVHASDTPRKLKLKLLAAGWPGLLRDLFLKLMGVRLDPSSKRTGERVRAQNLSST